MKLSQALIQRSHTKKRLDQLRKRLARSARTFEGEQVPEDPQNLLSELDQLTLTLTSLIAKINKTNSVTAFDESRVLTDALAERDVLMIKRMTLEALIQNASGEVRTRYQYGQSTPQSYSSVNIGEIQKQIDTLSRQYRELDDRIQEINWTTELLE